MNVTDIIKQARRAETTVELCLRPDVQAEIDVLDQQILELAERVPERLASDDDSAKLAARIHELEAVADDARVEFRFRALPTGVWRDLIVRVRDFTSDDATMDERLQKSYEVERKAALAAVEECLIGARPAKSGGDWEELPSQLLADLLDSLSEGQVAHLCKEIVSLNEGVSRVPKSLTALAVTPSSPEKPGPRERLASPGPAGSASSRKKDTTTTTPTAT